VNDFDRVAARDAVCWVVGAANNDAVDFDGHGPRRQAEVKEKLGHGDFVGNVQGASVDDDLHDAALALSFAAMSTEKLYWKDPFATSFEAGGARASRFGERASIVLERTLFYPEGGGQLADAGTLRLGDRELRVEDVQIDEAEEIHHIVPELLEVSVPETIQGSIDEGRRRDHMAQHTAQHMLSCALADISKAETVSARLGTSSCTIDLNLSALPDRELARAEDTVNAVVMNDVVVRALFPSPEGLREMKLRREPKVASNVRIIDIDGFDLSPCGGTHCTRTGQIGPISVLGTERYKGKLRVSFVAGLRALADSRSTRAVLGALAEQFTCGRLDVPGAVNKLQADLKARLDALSMARGELAVLVADRLLEANPRDPSGTTRIVVLRERDDIGMLRTLAGRLAKRDDVVAFSAAPDEGSGELTVVVQKGAAAIFDCARWFKEVALPNGGRGGGRADRAEGRLPRLIDLASLVRLDQGTNARP
jgi:alanyl-tRNA synthetase